MKITLINPPYTFWKSDMQYLERVLGHTPPLGLLSLAAYVRRNIHEAKITIVDAPAASLSVPQTVDKAVCSAPDVVGITVTSMVLNTVEQIAKQIKAALPNAKFVAGGPHISGSGPACFSQLSDFDVAVAGEGEQTFAALLEVFKAGKALDSVEGIMFRDARGQICQTKKREYFGSLDGLPMPAWDLLEGFPQTYLTNIFFSPQGPSATLNTSRGCPFKLRIL